MNFHFPYDQYCLENYSHQSNLNSEKNLTMKILTLEDLISQGLSIPEVQKSLTMTYLSKQFRRKSDLPKKFREKALSLCAEIEDSGRESFVIETNYSYTVWEEEKSLDSNVKIGNNSSNSLTENNANIDASSMPVFYSNTVSLNQVKVNPSSEEKTIVTQDIPTNSGKREYNLFQYTANHDSLESIRERKNQRLSFVSETTEEVVKYRGVAFSQPITPTTIASKVNQSVIVKKQPRTYRGVAY